MYTPVKKATERRLIKNTMYAPFSEVKAAGVLLRHTQASLLKLCGVTGVENVFLSNILDQIKCVHRLLEHAVYEYELAVCDISLWADGASAMDEAVEVEKLITGIVDGLKRADETPAGREALHEYMGLPDHEALPLLRQLKAELDRDQGQA